MNTPPDRTPRLCLIKNGTAYFTTQPIADQWGGNWNGIPYEHNAGSPYGPTIRDEKVWEIIQAQYVVHEGSYQTPEHAHNLNSPYSVRDINAGKVPWLIDEAAALPPIHAGCPLETFIALIVDIGGACCVKRAGHENQWYALSKKVPPAPSSPSMLVSLASIEERLRRLEVDSHPKMETVPLGRFVALEKLTEERLEILQRLAESNENRAVERWAQQQTYFLRSLKAQETATAAYTKSVEVLEGIAGGINRVAACYYPSVAACTHENKTPLGTAYVMQWCRDCGAVRTGENGIWNVPPIESESQPKP